MSVVKGLSAERSTIKGVEPDLIMSVSSSRRGPTDIEALKITD